MIPNSLIPDGNAFIKSNSPANDLPIISNTPLIVEQICAEPIISPSITLTNP